MEKLICQECQKVHVVEENKKSCPVCGNNRTYNFRNSDTFLKREVPRIKKEREEAGLDRLTGRLRCVVINVEPFNFHSAVSELLERTGFNVSDAFEDSRFKTVVLSAENSADLLVRCRLESINPFISVPGGPKSRKLPNTRLESFFFETPDVERYMEIQRERGVVFLDCEQVRDRNLTSVQTIPSAYTGLSIGVMEGSPADCYRTSGSSDMNLSLSKSPSKHLKNIGILDHTATRVRAKDRDAAIIEFMGLTGYDFEFAIYVKTFNSITNVARMKGKEFAMVFTSGIVPDDGGDAAGPTEKFIRNYGIRVHHMALRTERIQETYGKLSEDGQEFMIELVGSPEEGLRQTFSEPSQYTMLVTELIQRYGNFRGFFTKGNVTDLTGATEGQ